MAEIADNSTDKGGWAEVAHICAHVVDSMVVPESQSDFPSLNPLPECSVDGCRQIENWVCLKCHKVFCGRYGNKHMVSHYTDNPDHCIALGTGDLSFWCYKCDMYLNHLSIRDVFDVYQIVHVSKFNEPIPEKLAEEADFSAHDMYLQMKYGTTNPREKKRIGTQKSESKDTDGDTEMKEVYQDNDKKKRSKRPDPATNPIYRDKNKPKTSGASTALDNDEITEYFDDEEMLRKKAKMVAELLRKCDHGTVHTGAGVSTAAKLADYRGPQGFWTLQAQGGIPKTGGVTLEQALPTFTHMALKKMVDKGMIKHVISTNVDGLHRRSGIHSKNLSELHGNVYLEYCQTCGAEYLRTFDVTKWQKAKTGRRTGRLCEEENCNGKLRDSVVAFGENLPERELSRAIKHACQSDFVMVMGSSMRVSPACELPTRHTRGGKFVLVNLQKTNYDQRSHIRVFGKCDEFMKMVCEELGLKVEEFSKEQMVTDLSHIRLDPDF